MSKQKPLPRLSGRWLQDPELQKLFAVISRAGGEARVAGGAVRDALMRLPVGEVDLATTLKPDAVIKAARKAGLKCIPTGLEHGTVTVIAGGKPFEVTTLRRDVATDGRHAEVEFSDDWREDALRRDFTMNAMMCDAAGKVYDFTGGYDDIRRNRIIFVGVAKERIREDYLRILRYFRFLARFGSDWSHKASLDACVLLRGGLKSLSAERICSEMLKLLAGQHAAPVLKLMARRNVLKQIIPHTDDWRLVGRLPPDPILRLAGLAREPLQMQAQWRLSNAQAKRLEQLSEAPPLSPDLRPAEQRHFLYLLGPAGFRDAAHMAWARSTSGEDDKSWRRLLSLPQRWQAPVLPVNGGDLIHSGMKPGPQLGRELKRLEDYWIASDFKASKQQLLAQLGGQDG